MSETSEQPFWDFTLAHYGAEGVSAAVIGLQERRGADVNLLFYCCWCARTGRGPLSLERLREADDAVAAWRDGVTLPLRRVRDAIKGQEALAAMPDAMEMRRKVLAAEVDAERVAQLAMEAVAPPAEGAAVKPLADAAASLLTCFDMLAATPEPEDRAALAALLTAVFPGSDAGDVKAALAAVRPATPDRT